MKFSKVEMEVESVEAWVKRLQTATREAILDFGRYTFWDKGPYEVMDTGTFADELKLLDGAAAGTRLQALATADDEGAHVATSLLGELDRQPDAWWEACVEAAPDVMY